MPLQLPSALSRLQALFPSTAHGASSGAELVTSDGRSLALVGAKLVGEAAGGLARLVLEQTFANHYAEVLRVTYRMPLPADGAVSGYAFQIGERTVTGVVDKKHRARERFERAIASGHTAALLEQERADIFTQQIGNLAAGERVVARITIDQRLAWLPEGEWELRFPTVIGPRYVGSADTIDDARATHVKVTTQPLGVTFQISLAIGDAITGGAKPSSPSHALTRLADGRIELASGTRLDRDIVVRWPVAAAAPGLALDVARRAQGDAFGLVTIVPPARAAKATPVARDLLVLLDTSGSMGGGPLAKAKQVVAMMIDSLGDGDRLELIEFSDAPRRWREEPELATAKVRHDAIKWLRSREASGGTEMRRAVIESLQTLRIGAQRQVVLVTDGYVGGEQQILDALHQRMPRSCRLHVLGVGSAVNRSLATALARAGRGAEVLVGIDEDAERGAKRLLDRTKLPMLTNVEVAGSALIRHAPEKVPDVFEGAPLVAALALVPEGGELVVRGQLAGGESWEQRIAVPAKPVGAGNQAIAALYGRERVADVEAHAPIDGSGDANGEIEGLGLEFQIATRMTSWVAIDESRVVKGPSRDELIPQELPYGTSAGAFGLRAAAAGSGPVLAEIDAAMDMADGPSDALAMPASAPMAMPMMQIPAPAQFGYAPQPSRSVAIGGPGGGGGRGGEGSAAGASDDADEFEQEEPTGQIARERSETPPPEIRAPRPMESTPMPRFSPMAPPPPAAPVSKALAEPIQAKEEAKVAKPAAAPDVVTKDAAQGEAKPEAKAKSEAEAKPEAKPDAKRAMRWWLIFAALVAAALALAALWRLLLA